MWSVLKCKFLHILERNLSGIMHQFAFVCFYLCLFLRLNALLTVPFVQENEILKCIQSRNVHGGLRQTAFQQQKSAFGGREILCMLGLSWCQAITHNRAWASLQAQRWPAEVLAHDTFYSLAGGWPCSAKAWVANSLTHNTILNCCY